MDADDKYFFDLTGYLVLREVLTAAEVAALNAGIDHHCDQMQEIDRTLAGRSKSMQGRCRQPATRSSAQKTLAE